MSQSGNTSKGLISARLKNPTGT